LFLITLFTGVLQAQITLEETYNNSVSTAWIDGEGYKYFEMDAINNVCSVYNLDHTVYSTINLDVPDGQYLYNIKYVTNHTFDADDDLELCYIYYSYDVTNEYYTYTTKIINKDGSEILTIEGASYITILNVSEQDTDIKFLAYVYDYSVTPYTVQTKVYNLVDNGTSGMLLLKNDIGNAYPVPADSEIHLPVSLDSNNSGVVSVFSIQGQKMGSYKIGENDKSFRLNTQSFPSGTYIYQIAIDNRVINGNKFIVKH